MSVHGWKYRHIIYFCIAYSKEADRRDGGGYHNKKKGR